MREPSAPVQRPGLSRPFDRIYVISLAHRTDRRREMAGQLRRIGLSFESPEVRLFDAVKPDSKGEFPTVGARGCFLSHLGVLREAATAGCRSIAILEDDLDFSPEAAGQWPQPVLEPGLHGASIAYGGHLLAHDGGRGWVGVRPETPVQTAHFIGFFGAAIGDCASYLEGILSRPAGHPDGGPMHVDGAYCWFRRSRPDLRTVAHMPPLGHQRSSRTDIHDHKWYDVLPAARQIVALLRKARNRWKRSADSGKR